VSLIARQNDQLLSAVASLQDDLSMLRVQVAQLHERVSKLEQDR
jgi:ubiquinone biosynthesis protein UbiJ